MSNKAKIGLIGGIVLVLIILIYFFGINRDKSYVTDNWIETYDPADKGPYGTYVMKELLDTVGLFGDFIEIDSKVEKSLEDDEDIYDIYFFIGPENHIKDESIDKLLTFIDNGNTAFIATQKMPDLLNDEFFLNTFDIYQNVRDSAQILNFEHPELRHKSFQFDYVYNNKIDKKYWKFYQEDNFDLWDENEAFILGRNEIGMPNFIKITYGEGAIFFHSNPYVFTNVCMLKSNGFEYAENILKHIPPGRVQWDRYNLNRHWNSNNGNNGSGGGEERRSIMEFIFKNKPLTWAFIILVITAFLYAVFKGKRMQDIVKPVESKENTSLRYIDTISSLYLQEKKHGKLIHLKEKTFLNYIAEHYYLSSPKIDEKFIDKLAEKSQVQKDRIKDIFSMFDGLKSQAEVEDDTLIELHRRIEYFYKKCK